MSEERWGVWCIPTHEKTKRWPEHWWGQFWSTTDRKPLGEAMPFDSEDKAKGFAARQQRVDDLNAYSYEARRLPEAAEMWVCACGWHCVAADKNCPDGHAKPDEDALTLTGSEVRVLADLLIYVHGKTVPERLWNKLRSAARKVQGGQPVEADNDHAELVRHLTDYGMLLANGGSQAALGREAYQKFIRLLNRVRGGQ